MNARRRRLTEGTEVLWSTVTYVPVILCASAILIFTGPIVAPLEVEAKPVPRWFFWGLIGFFVLTGPFVFRAMCLKPLKLLAREIGDAEVLRDHTRKTALRALPYVPLMALPAVLLCLSLDGKLFWLNLLAIIGIDHLVTRWRNRPIRRAVDELMTRPSGWSRK